MPNALVVARGPTAKDVLSVIDSWPDDYPEEAEEPAYWLRRLTEAGYDPESAVTVVVANPRYPDGRRLRRNLAGGRQCDGGLLASFVGGMSRRGAIAKDLTDWRTGAAVMASIAKWVRDGKPAFLLQPELASAVLDAAGQFEPIEASEAPCRVAYVAMGGTGWATLVSADGGVWLVQADVAVPLLESSGSKATLMRMACIWDMLGSRCVEECAPSLTKKQRRRHGASASRVRYLKVRRSDMTVVQRRSSGAGKGGSPKALHYVRSHVHRYWVGSGQDRRLEPRRVCGFWRGGGASAEVPQPIVTSLAFQRAGR